MDSFQQPDTSNLGYILARSPVASWLNDLAGNPVDIAPTSDGNGRVLIHRGIT